MRLDVFEKIFPPKEVKDALSAVKSLEGMFVVEDVISAQAPVIVLNDVRQTIRQRHADTVASIREQGWNPRDLALLLISKRAFAHAASGAHHVYRATPGPVGLAMKAIFHRAGTEMVLSGFISEDDHQQDLRELEKAMREVG